GSVCPTHGVGETRRHLCASCVAVEGRICRRRRFHSQRGVLRHYPMCAVKIHATCGKGMGTQSQLTLTHGIISSAVCPKAFRCVSQTICKDGGVSCFSVQSPAQQVQKALPTFNCCVLVWFEHHFYLSEELS
ncbi:hypothetical protein DQ04_26691000, partial [Trypanosoma grayi]|uniref:hypothetical protein n=1 Tax=Trypanosoma grayi TaxID=71804 RepID=UPI0004F4895B